MFHFHLTSLRCQDCENGGSQTVNISNIKGGGPPAPQHMLVYTSRVQYKEFLYHSGRYKNSLCSCSFLYDSYYLWPPKTLQNEPHSACYCLSMASGFIHFHLAFIHYKLRFYGVSSSHARPVWWVPQKLTQLGSPRTPRQSQVCLASALAQPREFLRTWPAHTINTLSGLARARLLRHLPSQVAVLDLHWPTSSPYSQGSSSACGSA